jgi:hypothetical protein
MLFACAVFHAIPVFSYVICTFLAVFSIGGFLGWREDRVVQTAHLAFRSFYFIFPLSTVFARFLYIISTLDFSSLLSIF